MKEIDHNEINAISQQTIFSDYSNLDRNLDEWININEHLPENLLIKIKKINPNNNIKSIILNIKKELFNLYGDKKRDTAKSFSDSRFTPLNEMIERRMATCGSATKIIGTGLREIGIPVKFIHGILGSQKESFIKRVLLKERHAWLEIYIPTKNIWFPIDVTRSDLNLYPDAERIKEYHNWDELKINYKNGDF